MAMSALIFVQPQTRQQLRQDVVNRFGRCLPIGPDSYFRIFRRFIGGIDSGEAFQLAGPRFLIQAFWIALLANRQGCVPPPLPPPPPPPPPTPPPPPPTRPATAPAPPHHAPVRL